MDDNDKVELFIHLFVKHYQMMQKDKLKISFLVAPNNWYDN